MDTKSKKKLDYLDSIAEKALQKALADIANGEERIELDWDKLGTEGAARIAEALKGNTSVTELRLDYNQIGAEGAGKIAEALEVNTSVTELRLDCNQIGNEGAGKIAEALKVNTSVTELRLDYNQIGNEGAAKIAETLKANTSVTHLDLSDNKIGKEGAGKIAETLMVNSSLQTLFMRNNPIEIEGVLSLANAVKYGATSIRTLIVGKDWNQMDSWHVEDDLYQIGEGKFGRALKGIINFNKDEAVLKIPHEESSKDALYETLILQALPPHENVVNLFGFISDMGIEDTKEKGKLKRLEKRNDYAVVLAVELHKNGSLKSLVEHRPVRELKGFLRLALGMSQAINHLHKYNIIHRDIASRNFVLSEDYKPILIDFGLSCHLKEGQSAIYGAKEPFPFNQSAPETLFTGRSWKASDVWMFGVTLWQMLGIDRATPFINYGSVKILREFLKERYLKRKFEFPLFYHHNITAEIKELINMCCHFKYEKRPTMNAVIEKIEGMQLLLVNKDLNDGPERRGDEPESSEDESESSEDEPESSGDEPEGSGDEPERSGNEPEKRGDEPKRSGNEPERSSDVPERSGGDDPKRSGDEPKRNDDFFEVSEAKEGDLSVYAGSNYSTEEYYHCLEIDAASIEEYYSVICGAQDGAAVVIPSGEGEFEGGVFDVPDEREEEKADDLEGYDIIPASEAEEVYSVIDPPERSVTEPFYSQIADEESEIVE